ncbi:MAG: arylamine N-acetyltransferase [Acidobacteria bacterium]|nr:arylamine N-acetyltransferase [Acidobacteriota bacterium]
MDHHLLTDRRRFDLDAYCARIGYDGPRAATLDTLRELHVRHTQAIAFENINPLLRWPVRLDTASLVQKLILDGRGGYCFEQNLLFAHALHALGFHFGGLAARVVYGASAGTIAARGHMLLRIELHDKSWIADVGFGGLTLTGPLTVTAGDEQPTPHEPFRLVTVSHGHYMLEVLVRDTWTPLYRFSLDAAFLPDYEMASYYLCHFPQSHFITGLIAARPAPGVRHALRNAVLTTYQGDGTTESRILATGPALRKALESELALRLPDSRELDDALERLASAPAP